MKRILMLVTLLAFLLPGSGVAGTDRSGEVQKLMSGLESASRLQRVNAAKVISRSGYRDENLYLKIEALLKAGYRQQGGDDHIDEMAWLCKALAASGEVKYRALLDEIATEAPSLKLQRYARQSAELIDQYAQRSRVINRTETWDDSLSGEENRFINMLKSDDLKLRRDAAKMALRNVNVDPKVFDAAAEALASMIREKRSDTLSIDTMAWLCKALAGSGDSRYGEVLQQVYAATPSLKLRGYAEKALRALSLNPGGGAEGLERLVEQEYRDCRRHFGRSSCDRDDLRRRISKRLEEEKRQQEIDTYLKKKREINPD